MAARLPLAMPMMLHETLEDAGLPEVQNWWAKLEAEDRRSLLQLWADCQGGAAEFTVHAMKLRVVATPMTGSDSSDTFEGFWNHEFYSYLVNHEEYYFEEVRFHVCTSQPQARRALEAGVIPRGHECPHSGGACPMKLALASPAFSGKSIRLGITFVPGARTGSGEDAGCRC